MIIDDKKIMEAVNIEETTKDKIVLNVNGEKILKQIYEDNKITIEEDDGYISLFSNNQSIIDIHLHNNPILSKKECRQLAIETKNRIDNLLKNSLGIEEE